jgi:ribosomal protein S20
LDKKVKTAAAEKASDLASTASAYVSALDKAVKNGVIHANKAARQKAAVAKLQKL